MHIIGEKTVASYKIEMTTCKMLANKKASSQNLFGRKEFWYFHSKRKKKRCLLMSFGSKDSIHFLQAVTTKLNITIEHPIQLCMQWLSYHKQ